MRNVQEFRKKVSKFEYLLRKAFVNGIVSKIKVFNNIQRKIFEQKYTYASKKFIQVGKMQFLFNGFS